MRINRDLDSLLDAPDNCPNVPNEDQTDSDSDGLGNDCDPTPVPEPAQLAMLAAGVMGLSQLHRRRRKKGQRKRSP
jgi:hypothetical protein